MIFLFSHQRAAVYTDWSWPWISGPWHHCGEVLSVGSVPLGWLITLPLFPSPHLIVVTLSGSELLRPKFWDRYIALHPVRWGATHVSSFLTLPQHRPTGCAYPSSVCQLPEIGPCLFSPSQPPAPKRQWRVRCSLPEVVFPRCILTPYEMVLILWK